MYVSYGIHNFSQFRELHVGIEMYDYERPRQPTKD